MTEQSKQKKKIVIPGRPKKRLFLGMLSLATVLAAVLLYGIWYIASPGPANIAEVLPTIVGGIFAISVAISLLGILNMGLAVADWPYLPLLQRQTYELVNLLFPVSVRLAKLFGISKRRLEGSFIATSNRMFNRMGIRVPASPSEGAS